MKRKKPLTHGSGSETQKSSVSAAKRLLERERLVEDLTQAIIEVLAAHPIYASMTVIATASANNVTVTGLDGPLTTVSA